MMVLEKITKFMDQHQMLPEGGLVLAAVSGGADSMCLLTALTELARTRRFSLAAVHYNHMLRGGDSDKDARFVERFCRDRGIPCHMGSGNVAASASQNGLGTEEAAREMRYNYFYSVAEELGAEKIATAHTADDNAETILMNLTRGSGLRGLCGIPPTRGILIRPLLAVTRTQVEDDLRARSVPYVEDATNAEMIYTRNKLRHQVIPVLKEINPNLALNLRDFSERLRQDEDYLCSLAEDSVGQSLQTGRIGAEKLAGLPAPVAARAIKKMAGRDLSSKHIASVMMLCVSDNPSGELSLPGLVVSREYGDLAFSETTGSLSFCPVKVQEGTEALIPELNLRISCVRMKKGANIHKSFNTFLFKYDAVYGKILARPRKPGDKLALSGRNRTKSLKKLFIEERVPRRKRSGIPVLSDERGVIGVYGFGVDRRVLPGDGDTVLKIQFEEIIER